MNKIILIGTVFIAFMLMVGSVTAFEIRGPITINNDNTLLYTVNDLPMFYIDIDDSEFGLTEGESLKLTFDDPLTLSEDGFEYTSVAWMDENDRYNIAWLGEKYLTIDNNPTLLSRYIVDFDSSESITLKTGESYNLGEGLVLIINEIDTNGDKVWLVLEDDGKVVKDFIVKSDSYGYYETTVAGEDDVIIMKLHIDTVFAGMTTNMVIINDIECISTNVIDLDNNEYFGLDFSYTDTSISLQSDDKISMSKGNVEEIIPDFLNIRVGDVDDEVRMYVFTDVIPIRAITDNTVYVEVEKIVYVEVPTETSNETNVVPVETTNVISVETSDPLNIPGFEAIFAVAGLLAVVYLILRQRD